MNTPDARNPVTAALFLDFGNIYAALLRRDRHAADVFAQHPQRWLSWLERELGAGGPPNSGRVITHAVCYLDPHVHGEFSAGFTRAGFQVVNCPSLTSRGKNGADIYMVLGALDVLNDPAHHDEVILFNLGTDFTPLYRQLRAHDRRVVMLGGGSAGDHGQRTCDRIISDDVFSVEALGQAPAPLAVPVLTPTPVPAGTVGSGSGVPAVELVLPLLELVSA